MNALFRRRYGITPRLSRIVGTKHRAAPEKKAARKRQREARRKNR